MNDPEIPGRIIAQMAIQPLMNIYAFPPAETVVSMAEIYIAIIVPTANIVITGIVHLLIVFPIKIELATINPKKKLQINTGSVSKK